jgi:Protein of unknown function (DUF2950)
VNGKMIGGLALVAYPAEYRNSGVMTPNSSWKKTEVTEPTN